MREYYQEIFPILQTPVVTFHQEECKLSHHCRLNPLVPTVAFSQLTPLESLRVDSALRALSTLRDLRGAPEVPPLCRETQSLGQHMLERWEKMG